MLLVTPDSLIPKGIMLVIQCQLFIMYRTYMNAQHVGKANQKYLKAIDRNAREIESPLMEE